MDKETAKQQVKELVEKYDKIVSEDLVSKYNEERTKIEFIDPLFEALGWDVRNRTHRDEVTREERVSKGRVDYGFRINGIPKFFLEAKSLKADLDNPQFADQAINYAWHKGCTWAVLTDFEAIKIFNAEWKTANLFQNRFISLDCNQFLEQFDQLWLLSKESFEQGLLDKEAEKWGKKSKKSPVGEQLFSDLTKWRSELSKDILQRNKGIKEVDLDEAVQRIIDRLIFIRNCEDRELEPPTLLSTMREWDSKRKGSLAENIVRVFKHFDNEYNSKLFQHHLCDDLDVSNQVLEEIIEDLYHTKDRTIKYDFSALDADVLGNVYEQYLGHILKKTAKRAVLEEKRTYRKEQGIYYTPTYIVDYIVRNTLGELLKDKKADVENIRILDPACGSGSFLIKAFDVLNEFYSKKKGDQAQTQLDLESGLPFTKKSKILQNNIFGVDLDTRAVEIAQLNLLLKIAEKKQRLPLLQQNIKCGNSLIDDEKVAGGKAFKWRQEFKRIMDDGGFDIVIGNPPYVRQEELLAIKPYLESSYQVYHSMADLFVYFFEREFKLLKEGGYFGMIVSNKWLKAGYALGLRRFLSKYWIERFIDFGDLPVFQDATTYPCILVMKKTKKLNPKMRVCQVKKLNFDSLENYCHQNEFLMNQKDLDEKGWNFKDIKSTSLLKKIDKISLPLKEYVEGEVYRGILTGLSKAFVIDEKTKSELEGNDPRSKEIIEPFLTGKEVRRYGVDFKHKYIILTKIGVDMERYSAVLNWLNKFKKELEKRWDKGNYWYELRACDYYGLFKEPKLIYGVISVKPRFTIDTDGYYANNANFFIPTSDKKLLGILNSKLGWFLISNTCTQIRGGYQLIWKYFGNVPIAKADSPELEKLVEKMLSFNKHLNEIGDKKTDERYRIEEEIKKIDAEIDELVYKLYGITESEKKIIEESLR